MSTTARIRLTSAGKTDPGRVREHNEDRILVAPEYDLFVVADGMGGHSTGHIASTMVTKSVKNFFEATSYGPYTDPGPDEDKDEPPEVRRLLAAIRKCNRDVHEISTSHENHKGMGSTVVAIHAVGNVVHIAHVGDSRCYRIRDGQIEQLTRDHSLRNEALALKPNLSPAQLAKLPKNVVSRALGMKDSVKIDRRTEVVLAGDLFLLCSDGLSGMVPDPGLVECIDISEDLSEVCDLLVASANEAGGNDNISAVLVRVEEVGVAAASPTPAPARADAVVVARETSLDDTLAQLKDMLSTDEIDLIKQWEEENVLKKLCRRCGTELIPGNFFCVQCGMKI